MMIADEGGIAQYRVWILSGSGIRWRLPFLQHARSMAAACRLLTASVNIISPVDKGGFVRYQLQQ